MSIPRDLIRDEPGLGRDCILHGWRGSIAHGTYEPSSDPNSIDDKDTMAFCVPPIDHYYGLAEYGSRGTREIQRGEWDIVIYEARKAIRLLAGGNPNALSMLWLPDNLYIDVTDAGRLLLDNRDLFVGKHVYKPYIGYATQQFQRMERGAYQGFMGAKRKALVDRYGYDAKSASHLIRLLRQGIEFLHEGEMTVQRYDASELLAIKHGEWTLDQVKSEARHLFRRAEAVYDQSILPAHPDRDAIGRLCVEVVTAAHAERHPSELAKEGQGA